MDGTTSIELPRLRWTESRRVRYERTTIGAEWMSAVRVDVRNLFSARVPRLAIIAVFVLMAFSWRFLWLRVGIEALINLPTRSGRQRTELPA